MNIPPDKFREGVLSFRQNNADEMYNLASRLVDDYWYNPKNLASAIGLLLLVWNQAYYRYGHPNFNEIENFLYRHTELFKGWRPRHISTASCEDLDNLKVVFLDALDALKIAKGTFSNRRSSVSVSKALHILAPNFFPLWDYKIANAYGCRYQSNPVKAYLRFIKKQNEMLGQLNHVINELADNRSQLKVLDEYNYDEFTDKQKNKGELLKA